MELYGKLSRLYVTADLKTGAGIALDDKQAHYLRNVLRKESGDTVRLFNGRDGEWLAELQDVSKKGVLAAAKEQIRKQPQNPRTVHLLFAPLKKDRMDFLIEKSVELGATHFHPVITARTDARNLNYDRITAQIVEAAEQCERMDVPALLPEGPLKQKLSQWDKKTPIHWAYERSDTRQISVNTAETVAFLIGPAGGFDETEAALLSNHESVKPISLGENVYRAETACLLCLASLHVKS